jgi:hypothetical protein
MKLVTQITITSILIVFSVVVIAVILADQPQSSVSVTIQEQPQREKYIAPEWVVNERGQRCIKQGDIVTCG